MKRRVIAVLGLLVGCSTAAGNDEELTEAAPPGEPVPSPSASATSDGGPKKASLPPLTGKPTDEQLTEKYGLFVSTKGSANGAGTRERPLSSIRDAIARAKGDARRVYVCEGTYRESLILESGISVIGGFDCSAFTWKLGTAKSRLEATESPAVRASGIAIATRFEGFDVVAPDGTEESPSSIALIADQSPTLTIVRSKFASGKGFDGADGVEGIQLEPQTTPASHGFAGDGPRLLSPGSVTAGGVIQLPEHPTNAPAAAGGTNVCKGAAGHDGEAGGAGNRGGSFICKQLMGFKFVGGRAVPYYYYGWDPMPAIATIPGGVASGLENPAAPAEKRSGEAGSPGPGSGGQQGGTLVPAGYIPADGIPGGDGTAGHGGSGGTRTVEAKGLECPESQEGYAWTASSGGGGGYGGCPGLAGTPGKGGGASIGGLVFASKGLTIEDSELVASAGGAGGKGTMGSSASPGGLPGKGGNGVATAGSSGGVGGRAGVSGSGGGGPSYGLAFTGGALKLTSTTAKAGTGGAGRPADSKTILGGMANLPASPSGAAKEIYSF